MFTGFSGTHRDIPPAVVTQKDLVEDEGDPNPCPEDDADCMKPDAEQMEEAIGNFMDDMEKQEHGCLTVCCGECSSCRPQFQCTL